MTDIDLTISLSTHKGDDTPQNLDPDIGSIYIFHQYSHFLRTHAVITPQIRPQTFLSHKLQLRIS